MDISHISAGRANATSRAIGHPSSRAQETRRCLVEQPTASRELFIHTEFSAPGCAAACAACKIIERSSDWQ